MYDWIPYPRFPVDTSGIMGSYFLKQIMSIELLRELKNTREELIKRIDVQTGCLDSVVITCEQKDLKDSIAEDQKKLKIVCSKIQDLENELFYCNNPTQDSKN